MAKRYRVKHRPVVVDGKHHYPGDEVTPKDDVSFLVGLGTLVEVKDAKKDK